MQTNPIITDTENLKTRLRDISDSPYITVDTEFIRDIYYYPKLCLIQVATKDTSFILDPISPLDLSPFLEILENPDITKVFHAGRQDIEIFYYMTGFVPKSVFDTQIAGMVLGFGDSVSYEKLVQDLLDKKLDKSQRFTHWDHRPLSARQIEYALADVHYLCEIYEIFSKQLKEKNREHWIEEEMTTLLDPKTYDRSPESAWERFRAIRSSKYENKSDQFFRIARELVIWREDKAQKQNRPKRAIFSDETLLELAELAPTASPDLARVRYVKHLSEKDKTELFDVIKSAKESDLKVKNQDKSGFRKRYYGSDAVKDLFRALLKSKAEEYEVAERLIADSSTIERFAMIPAEEVSAGDFSFLHGWREEVFGNDALKLKKGQITVGVRENGMRIIEM